MTLKPPSNPLRANPSNTLPEPISAPESISKKVIATEWPDRYVDLVALYTASARLSPIIDWDALLKETLQAGVQLMQAQAGALMLVDKAAPVLYIAEAYPWLEPANRTPIKIGDGIVGRVAQQLQPVLLNGCEQMTGYPDSFPLDRVASAVCAPLAHSSQCGDPELLGVLVLARPSSVPAYTRQDLTLVSAYCASASTALQNARCYRRMQRRAVQLENLIEISRNLIGSLEVDVVLHSIVNRAVELLHSLAGSLLLVDSETHELVFKVAVGPVAEKLVGTRLPPGVGIVGAVARDGKPLIVNDAKSDPRHYGQVDANTALKTESLLCVPLINQGNIIGVVEVMNKVDGMPFDEEDRDLLSAFAVQGAIALENARLYSDLRRAFADTVRVIANAVEARDQYTRGHTGRVTQLALATAQEMGWSREELEILEIGALLHDIGKIGISDTILLKPTELTDEEYKEMMRHPVVGAKMLEGVAGLRPMLPYVLYHQERFDGRGYPFGLKGNEIPPEGRILAVVDTFDAMTSNRPYRSGLNEEEAMGEILRNRGTQFDPDVVDALLRVRKKKNALP